MKKSEVRNDVDIPLGKSDAKSEMRNVRLSRRVTCPIMLACKQWILLFRAPVRVPDEAPQRRSGGLQPSGTGERTAPVAVLDEAPQRRSGGCALSGTGGRGRRGSCLHTAQTPLWDR